MKFLYGSQNFGFNLPNSDRDWMEIVMPTWDDVLHNRSVSRTDKNPDGSLTKINDLRIFNKHLMNGCFSDLQILWCTESYNSEEMQWWIDNRQRIARMSLMDLYTCNLGCIRQMYNLEANPKNLTHMYVFNTLLHRALDTSKDFSIYVDDSREYRNNALNMHTQDIEEAMALIMRDAVSLKKDFEKYRDHRDSEIEQMMYKQTINVIKQHIK